MPGLAVMCIFHPYQQYVRRVVCGGREACFCDGLCLPYSRLPSCRLPPRLLTRPRWGYLGLIDRVLYNTLM
jgi:hypothetical protein